MSRINLWSSTKQILLPEFAKRVVCKPARKLLRIQSLKNRLIVRALHNNDVLGAKLVEQQSRLS